MTEQQYNLFFQGQLLEGFSKETVKQQLQQRLKLSDKYMTSLFSGNEVRLKQQVDKATAIKFQQAFKAAGARLIVKLHNPDKPSQAAQEASSPSNNSALEANTSATAAQSSDSLIEHHQPAIKTPQTIPDWGVAAPGTDLVESKNKREHPGVEFDLSGLSLAEPGALMTQPGFEAPAPIIHTDGLSLDSNEGDIKTLHDEPEPVKVDIDYLSLKN